MYIVPDRDRVTLIYSFEKRKREIRMKKSFRCGRLEVLKNGDKRPLKITEGGGIRNCPWESIDMNLHEAHEALRRIFGLGNAKSSTSSKYDQDLFRCE